MEEYRIVQLKLCEKNSVLRDGIGLARNSGSSNSTPQKQVSRDELIRLIDEREWQILDGQGYIVQVVTVKGEKYLHSEGAPNEPMDIVNPRIRPQPTSRTKNGRRGR